jgi:hypothetical protein
VRNFQQGVDVINVDLPKLKDLDWIGVEVSDRIRGTANDERESILVAKHSIISTVDQRALCLLLVGVM